MRLNRKQIVEFIEEKIIAGYLSGDEIVAATAQEYIEDAQDKHAARARGVIEKLVVTAITEKITTEHRWLGLTDCDRLNLAFVELNRRGIVACQNLGCCNDCAHKDILKIADRRAADAATVCGYAFFHQRDVERVVRTGELNVSFNVYSKGTGDKDYSIETNITRARAIAAIIVNVLRAHGLKASWSGSYLQRITISEMKWERRQFTFAPDAIAAIA
jgi:hypothetical protein